MWAYLSVSVLMIVTPGPDTAVTIRSALFGRRRSGIFTALGVVSGQLVWAGATAAGVAALLAQSRPAFDAIRLAGAAYLVFLGLRSIYAAIKGESHYVGESGAVRGSFWSAYRQGLLSDLGNPKMAVFFTSLLPQFTGTGHAQFLPLLLLGMMFCVLTFVWLVGYATAVAKAGDVLHRTSVRRVLDGITGAVLIGLGARIAVETSEAM
jgi:threonine/homoserine/homoserine lactone efflux protein